MQGWRCPDYGTTYYSPRPPAEGGLRRCDRLTACAERQVERALGELERALALRHAAWQERRREERSRAG